MPRLYVIADQGSLEQRGLRLHDFADGLANTGVGLVQYRHKLGSPQEVLAGAAEIARAFRDSKCAFVMNDRADLACLVGWSGRIIGVSTHNDEQVSEAEKSAADYIAIGPVFPTGSKADTEPVVGLEGVRRARALTGKPLVAIGGITATNAAAVIAAGADSVAVIGAVLPTDGSTTQERVEGLLEALNFV